MAAHVIDLAAFRLSFPAFSDVGKFSDIVLTDTFTKATMFLGEYDGPALAGPQLQLALNYLTAHLQWSAVLLARGQSSVIVQGSTVDKVTVQLVPPPVKTGWQWWLLTTPYGADLWALLTLKSAGGFYVGGSPERSAFRTVGGSFGGRPYGRGVRW
jgi:hypothetical protein